MAANGVVGGMVDIINFERRPSYKDEIINGVNTCTPIRYADEEKPIDEKEFEKHMEMLDKLSKFRP